MNDALDRREALCGALALQLGLAAARDVRYAWLEHRRTARHVAEILEEEGALRCNRLAFSRLVDGYGELRGGDPSSALDFLLSHVAESSAIRQGVLDENRAANDSTCDPVSATTATIRPGGAHPAPSARDPNSTLQVPDQRSTHERLLHAPSPLRFEKKRLLGRGGLGEVWLAHDRELDREVALKEMLYADDADGQGRFVAEAAVTARLEHPGIVPIYAAGRYSDGRPYYAMRRIKNRTLKAAIDDFHADPGAGEGEQRRGARLRTLLGSFVNVCNAIAFAHEKSVLHRDLKPENIMLGDFGETLVLDWGLAKSALAAAAEQVEADELPAADERTEAERNREETMAGVAIGTLAYMSPEQLTGEATTASDVFGLGATLYYLLTGQSPFGGAKNLPAAKQAIRTATFPEPRSVQAWIPRPLAAICQKAMARDPAARYAAATELRDDIQRWLDDEPVAAYPDPLVTKARRWAKRNRVFVVTAASLFLALSPTLLIAYALLSAEQGRTLLQKERAESRFAEARQAVDDNLVLVTDDPQLQAAELKPLRNSLLQKGLTYYTSFVHEKSDDASIEAVNAGAKLRAAIIQQEMGNAAAAHNLYDEALDLFERLRKKKTILSSRSTLDLARGYHKYGDLLAASATSRNESIAAYERALSELQSITEAGARRYATMERASVHSSLGRWHKNESALVALSHCRQAVDLYELLNREFPADKEVRRGLAQGLLNLATLQQESRRLEDAQASYERARTIWETLDEQGQNGLIAKAAQGRILHDLGIILQLRGKLPEASRARQEALAVRRNVAFSQGYTHLSDLAQTCNDWGLQLCSQRKLAEGMQLLHEGRHYREQLALITGAALRERLSMLESYHNEANQLIKTGAGGDADALVRAQQLLELAKPICFEAPPGDAQSRELTMQRGWNRHLLGYLEATRNRLDGAEVGFQEALRIRANLVTAEPSSPQLIQDLLFTQLMLGNLSLRQGDREEAIRRYEITVETADRLAEVSADDPSAHVIRSTALYSLANAQFRAGKSYDVVRGTLQRAQRSLAGALPAGRDDLGRTLRLAVEVALHANEVGDAAEAARELHELFADDRNRQVEVAGLFCGILAHAEKLSEPAELQSRCQAEAVAALKRAIELGFRDDALLRSPKFAILAKNADFQSLLGPQMEK